MTIEEFKNTPWFSGMECTYHEEVYGIAKLDFSEMLVGLDKEDGEVKWVRCENIELHPKVGAVPGQ